MAKLYSLKAAFRRKKGFSLIAVMILSLINLAIMGVALQFAVSSSGGGRVNSAMAVKYNLLQNALEEGKARLKKSMKGDVPPHRYTDKGGIDGSRPGHITSSNVLLLTNLPSADVYPDLGPDFKLGAITKPLVKSELERIGIFGERGELTVKIYDMQYKLESVAEELEDLQSMPPAMSLSGVGDWEEGLAWNPNVQGEEDGPADYAGVYLIRAELSVYDNDDGTGDPIHTWSLETSVVQANNKK